MTTYQGGKKRLGKKIYQMICLIESDIIGKNSKLLPYFEPFVGMCGVIRHFASNNDRKVSACDINPDIITMWKEFQKGIWTPPKKCSRKKYDRLRQDNIPSSDRGFLGTVCSWSGIFFSGFRLDYNPEKDFVGEGYRGLMNIKPDISNIQFYNTRPYYLFKNVKNKLIYCDPPYKNNNFKTEYFQSFDHDRFWDVMRDWSANNIVVISESTAPKDFKKIWSAETTITNISTNTKKYQEYLFIHISIYVQLSSKLKKQIRESFL